MKKLISTVLGASALLTASPALAAVDTVQAPTGFFAPGLGDTLSDPYWRRANEDWGWTHGAIAGPITSAKLFISAYDVDFTEIDNIYAYDNGVRTLLGSLNQAGTNVFSFTEFVLGANFFDDIMAGLQVDVDIDVNNEGWRLTLGKSVLTTEGSDPGNPNPGIPEPSTWAMMILGFGLVGSALRRRRKASVRFAF